MSGHRSSATPEEILARQFDEVLRTLRPVVQGLRDELPPDSRVQQLLAELDRALGLYGLAVVNVTLSKHADVRRTGGTMNESETIAGLRDLLAHHGVPDFPVGAAPGTPEMIRRSLEALKLRVQRDTTCGATVEVDLAGGRVQYSAEEGGTTFRSAWFVFPFLAEGISDALIELEDRAYQAWTLAHPDREPDTLCPKCGSSRFHAQTHEITGEDLSYSVCASCGFEQGYDRESGAPLGPERD